MLLVETKPILQTYSNMKTFALICVLFIPLGCVGTVLKKDDSVHASCASPNDEEWWENPRECARRGEKCYVAWMTSTYCKPRLSCRVVEIPLNIADLGYIGHCTRRPKKNVTCADVCARNYTNRRCFLTSDNALENKLPGYDRFYTTCRCYHKCPFESYPVFNNGPSGFCNCKTGFEKSPYFSKES